MSDQQAPRKTATRTGVTLCPGLNSARFWLGQVPVASLGCKQVAPKGRWPQQSFYVSLHSVTGWAAAGLGRRGACNAGLRPPAAPAASSSALNCHHLPRSGLGPALRPHLGAKTAMPGNGGAMHGMSRGSSGTQLGLAWQESKPWEHCGNRWRGLILAAQASVLHCRRRHSPCRRCRHCC